jgi:hypothetical protein
MDKLFNLHFCCAFYCLHSICELRVFKFRLTNLTSKMTYEVKIIQLKGWPLSVKQVILYAILLYVYCVTVYM